MVNYYQTMLNTNPKKKIFIFAQNFSYLYLKMIDLSKTNDFVKNTLKGYFSKFFFSYVTTCAQFCTSFHKVLILYIAMFTISYIFFIMFFYQCMKQVTFIDFILFDIYITTFSMTLYIIQQLWKNHEYGETINSVGYIKS